jgi:hypothetical protein
VASTTIAITNVTALGLLNCFLLLEEAAQIQWPYHGARRDRRHCSTTSAQGGGELTIAADPQP